MVDLEFNFVGVETVDFSRALKFYTEKVGIELVASSPPESWAMLVSGMEDSPVAEARGLRSELFERPGQPPDERRREVQQNLRPSVQVEDLEATREALRERGVPFTGTMEETAWGPSIEFRTPGGVRWSLARAPGFPAGRGLATTYVGWAELKVADSDRQQQFYTQVMGLSVDERHVARVRLEQGVGDPQLFLESGGVRTTVEGADGAPFLEHPVWVSFETADIDAASAWFRSHDIPLIQEITSHDWAGVDIVIEDSEGNPIQVVEYLDH